MSTFGCAVKTKVARVLVGLLALGALRCGNEPLEVSIVQPENGAVVSGILRVEADASSGASGVSFFIDDSCVHFSAARPFVHIWNTFLFSDSAVHTIHALAVDQDGDAFSSDTISVEIRNGDTLFADGFEPYAVYSYPAAAWFEIWAGAGTSQTYVEGGVAYSGVQCFRLRGAADQVRTDGVELDLAGIDRLIYELIIMIPSSDSAGAMVGFFYLLSPYLGTIYNGIWFRSDDNVVYARGIAEDSTGVLWRYDTWHRVRVELDYPALAMDVWFDNEQIVSDLPAIPRGWADTFALATEYGTAGVVFFDNISFIPAP